MEEEWLQWVRETVCQSNGWLLQFLDALLIINFTEPLGLQLSHFNFNQSQAILGDSNSNADVAVPTEYQMIVAH